MRTQLLAAVAWAAGLVAAAKPPVVLPGLQRDGSVLLPNQWSLRPVGRQINVGDFPVNIALHPGGAFAAVLHSGWGQHEVRILDVKSAGRSRRSRSTRRSTASRGRPTGKNSTRAARARK